MADFLELWFGFSVVFILLTILVSVRKMLQVVERIRDVVTSTKVLVEILTGPTIAYGPEEVEMQERLGQHGVPPWHPAHGRP